MSDAKIVQATAGDLAEQTVEDAVRFTVYCILDPTTREPRYVGVTRRPLRARMESHWWLRKSGKMALSDWLLTLGERPPMRALATMSVPAHQVTAAIPPRCVRAIESNWITYLSARFPLVQATVRVQCSVARGKERARLHRIIGGCLFAPESDQ